MSSATGPQVDLYRCGECTRHWHTLLAGCPYCGATAIDSVRCDGLGTVYTWITVHRSMAEVEREVPYVIVAVDLDVGARVLGRYDGPEPQANDRVVRAVAARIDSDPGAIRFVPASVG